MKEQNRDPDDLPPLIQRSYRTTTSKLLKYGLTRIKVWFVTIRSSREATIEGARR